MVFPVFNEAAGTSARNHLHGTDRVEACRPLVVCDHSILPTRCSFAGMP